MTRNDGRRRAVRFALTAGLATVAALTGVAGTALAGTPAALPTGTIRAGGGGSAITGSYIVALKSGSSEAVHVTSASQQLVRRYGGRVHTNYLSALRGFQAEMSATEARRLASHPAVAFVEQDTVVTLADTQTDPVWGLDRIDQASLPLSQTYTYRSAANVTAYVLDTGIRISHGEFEGRASDGWDFIDEDSTAQDCNGHGTHVAGTVGGRTYGVAKDVDLVGVRVLDCSGSGSYSGIIAAIDWVTAHAVKPAVVNMSLGGSLSYGLNAAVARSVASGVTYAVAAGNDDEDACAYSPASAFDAITVGAVDSTDARATFSNYGTCLDIFAPGVWITSASYASDTGTQVMSGTSMAAPHVAGAAALVLGAEPSYTPAQVRDALVSNSTPGTVSSPGSGSVNQLLSTDFLNNAVPTPTATPTTAPTATPTTAPTATPTTAPTTTPATTTPATTAPTTAPATTAPPATTPPTTAPPTTTPAPAPTTVPPTKPPVTTCGPFTMPTPFKIVRKGTVLSRRTVSGCTGVPASATVAVTVTHPYRGSLVVTLISPNGTRYLLKPAKKTDRAANLAHTYPIDLSRASRNGKWTLQVKDTYGTGTGVLNKWKLTL